MSEKKEVVIEKETIAPVKNVGDTLFAVIQNPEKIRFLYQNKSWLKLIQFWF
jgi:hypothetical protein